MGQPWGIGFSRNGKWAVADYSNHCVYLYDGEDQLVKKIDNGGGRNSNNLVLKELLLMMMVIPILGIVATTGCRSSIIIIMVTI